MVESYLTQLGMRCGTVANFNTEILNDVRRDDYQHWYFLTPIKSTEKQGQLKECSIDMAFPFLANLDDTSERDVLDRLSETAKGMESALIAELRKRIIVSQFTSTIIPFWANEKGSERQGLKDFGNNRVHILNIQLTVSYRTHWF